MKATSMTRVLLVSLVAVGATTSCGSAKSAGENIAIAVTPTSAIVVPGTGASCTDKAENSTQTSVAPNRIFFRNFRLEWAAPDTLTVALIRVTIKHPSIQGGTYTGTISDKELNYMLGTTGGSVSGPSPGTKKAINSSDTTRGGGLPACGLALGSIELIQNASPFTAQADVTLIGYAETSDGVQYSVRKSTRATVEYY